jgi:glycosyltransferase involved in cell wall biosynthesis
MPNGVDPERFHPDNSDCGLRETYSIQPDDKVVLFVGGLDTPHYFKGVDVLLNSLKCIADPSVKMLIVGDGNLRETYMTLSRDLGLAGRVTFCGRVSDELLPAHYALSDLVVLPSTTRGEAFGIVLLEGMASGKPVIASNLPGVRTVVDDGENGLLVNPRDAVDLTAKICELASNRSLREEMGARGREKVEKKYAWPAVVARLEAVYQEVLGDGN